MENNKKLNLTCSRGCHLEKMHIEKNEDTTYSVAQGHIAGVPITKLLHPLEF